MTHDSPSPVLIVGSMAFDDLDLPTGSARDVVGGSATYSAYAASVFAPVRLVAVVGDDHRADGPEDRSRADFGATCSRRLEQRAPRVAPRCR